MIPKGTKRRQETTTKRIKQKRDTNRHEKKKGITNKKEQEPK